MQPSNQQRDPRLFLGYSQPPLLSAAAWLTNRFRKQNRLDMSNGLFVLPTTRAVLRLMQLLVEQANQERAIFTPPQIITIGEFPEHLYAVEKPLAPQLSQHLAWSKALSESEPNEIEKLFPAAVNHDSLDQWQPYAKLVSDLHQRLGNDVWSFSSVVREVLEHDKNF